MTDNTDGHVNPVQIQKYLNGVDYPASKQDLVKKAKSEGAGDNVVKTLEKMGKDEFDSPTDVTETIGDFE